MLHNTFPPRSRSASKPLTATLMQEFITMHEKFFQVYLACRSAHIWELQICLKIQQRQRNAKRFQSLLMPLGGSFNSKNFAKVFSTSAGGSVKSNR